MQSRRPPSPPPYDAPETIDLGHLQEWFAHSLSSAPDLRRRAQADLAQASAHPYFPFSLLRLVSAACGPVASFVDDKVRVAAAVMLSNLVRGGAPSVAAWEMELLKTLIVSLVLSLLSDSSGPADLRMHLENSLAGLCAGDSPESWHRPLLDLVLKLQWEASYSSLVAAVFGVAKSITGKLRLNRWDWALIRDLRRCFKDEYIDQVVQIFFLTARSIEGAIASSPAAGTAPLLRLIDYQTICYRIFRHLNAQLESPKSFRLHHHENWINQTLNYLNPTCVKNLQDQDNGSLGLLASIDELLYLICDNIIVCADKQYPLHPWKRLYLVKMLDPVIALLQALSNSNACDRLIIVAINSLIKISGLISILNLELSEDTRGCILRNIVIPNMSMTEEEEALFEADCVEFIRQRDGGRRRHACELLRVLITGPFRDDIVELVGSEVDQLLNSFEQNPEVNWKNKDCAMQLVSIVRKTLPDFDVLSFFQSAILTELQRQDSDGFPVLRAGALRFFTLFHTCLPESVAITLMPHLVDSLISGCGVVQSCAAICIEHLILLAKGGRSVALDIRPFAQKIKANLYSTLNSPECQDNPFIVKCIECVVGLQDILGETVEP